MTLDGGIWDLLCRPEGPGLQTNSSEQARSQKHALRAQMVSQVGAKHNMSTMILQYANLNERTHATWIIQWHSRMYCAQDQEVKRAATRLSLSLPLSAHTGTSLASRLHSGASFGMETVFHKDRVSRGSRYPPLVVHSGR